MNMEDLTRRDFIKGLAGTVALGAVPTIAHTIREEEINSVWDEAHKENDLRNEFYNVIKENSKYFYNNGMMYHRKSDHFTILFQDTINLHRKITKFNIPIKHLEVMKIIAKKGTLDAAGYAYATFV